ncbi:MAG: Glycine cleavage system transcriptional activator [Pseudidiomarina mangrovi]|nr:MAG: Glycine cleavage system transcriptional activator [Pseudidiomarina mangrovi]
MAAKQPSLNALRVFAIAAHAQSFKHAAQQLGVSQSAITRQVQALEQQLGTRLFQRDNRVHALTPAGQALAPELLRLFRDLEHTIDRVRDIGDSELTTLRLALPDSLLRWWLARKLPDFSALYPHIRLQFSTVAMYPNSHEKANICSQLQHEVSDIVVHYGSLKDKNIRQQRLYQPTICAVAKQAPSNGDWQRWVVDTQQLPWQHFSKRFATVTRQAQVQQAPDHSALDLLTDHGAAALTDSLLLSHPQLSGLTRHQEWSLQLPEAVFISYKERSRQPVALVAFSKWLESRINVQSVA